MAENVEINEYIKEYLRHYNFGSTAECFEAELRNKQVSSKATSKANAQKNEDLPRLLQLFKGDNAKLKRDLNAEKELKSVNKKYGQVLQAARQIFSVAVNCLQLLHNLKDVNFISQLYVL